ncbi:MAG: RNA polymerase sigma factor [Caldisericia bacterium]|nr:RNA polymerase sigma factor [Caldisericia bacterium]
MSEFEASKILKKVASGDEDAFRVLYEQFGGYVFKVVILSLRDRAKAEELAQTIWLKIWRFAGKYDTTRPFKPWLSRIISNELISYYRVSKPQKSSIDEMKGIGYEPGETEDDIRENDFERELSYELKEALEVLTDKQRQVIVLKYYQGFKIREIAGILKIGQSAVKARLYSGLEVLSKRAKKARYD